ncbi:MAG: FtsQ-type POTRA domain-containing protein [Candidatus Binatia bacterium]
MTSSGRARRNRFWWSRRAVGRWLSRARLSVLAALCGSGLAAALWYGVPGTVQLVRGHAYFALSRIELEGNRRLSRHEILHWAGLNAHASIWDARPDLLKVRLLSHPWIRNVWVRREFPNRLSIGVEERRPVAIVRLSELNYVDRGGYVLGPLRTDDSPDFPLITGLDNPKTADFVSVGVHRALRFLRLCERFHGFDAISEVRVDRDRGLTVFSLRRPVAMVLGWGGWREKLSRAARVLAVWEGQMNRVAAVDVSFRGMAVVKVHEESRPAPVRSKKGVRA